ncbi:MAG: hypothetical protein QW081_04905, partial [Desulfurococcaceae archaeon]
MEKLRVDKQKLREIIRELSTWRAHATILLSLYIPPGRPISDVLALLRQEISVAENIKLKRTRNAVEWALNVAYDRLSKIPKAPDKGLVLFAGMNPDTGESTVVMLIPPEPVPVFFYRTDKVFHVEFLEEMVSESNIIGILLIERDAATIGLKVVECGKEKILWLQTSPEFSMKKLLSKYRRDIFQVARV